MIPSTPARLVVAARAAALAAVLAVVAVVHASEPAAKPAPPPSKPAAAAAKADPRVVIAKKLEVGVEAVRPSPVAGLWEVAHGTEVLYVTADARFVLEGDLYDTDRKANVTEERRAGARVATLKSLTEAEVISFGPKNPTHTVTVFTDIDCGYCRKFHSEIAEYNRLGVRVRYAFYPRSGPGTESWQKAESVWCAPNRQDALTRAKAGEDVAKRNCKSTPLNHTYEVGRELGLRGTPGIFTERGDYVPGYLPPAMLVERLKSLAPGG